MKKALLCLGFLFCFLAASHLVQAQIITTLTNSVNRPDAMGKDDSGNIYIGDYGTATVKKVSSEGVVTVVAGNGTFATTGDGGPATAASFFAVVGVAFNHAGDMFVADENVIRKVDHSTGIITLFAGSGTGYAGDGGPATLAKFGLVINALAVDDTGNVYAADFFNNVIRRIDTFGIISTFAGTGTAGASGDGGPATAAELYYPESVATDHAGNLYIGDFGNRVVRKVAANGIISIFAGIPGSSAYTGDGGPAVDAAIMNPTALCTDVYGRLYIADLSANVIRKVDTSGIISTVAGNGFGAIPAPGGGSGSGGYTGDFGLADSAELNNPEGVVVDNIGNIYIADAYNNAIREVHGISGATHVCAGDSTLFAAVAPGGSWGVSGAGVISVNASSGMVTGIAAGSGVLYYYIGNDTAFLNVWVSATPYAGVITGSDSMCLGFSAAVADTMVGGVWSLTNGNSAIAGNVVAALSVGFDTVHYDITYTCGVGRASFVIQNFLVAAGVITGTDTICLGHTAVFTDTAPGGVWSIGDTTVAVLIAPGVVKGLAAGFNEVDYIVSIPGVTGCTSIASLFFVVDSSADCHPAGISTMEQKSATAQIYPNPFSGSFTIKVPEHGEQLAITITDILGRIVDTKYIPANNSELQVNMSGMPRGTYLVKVQYADRAEIHKIVAE